MAQYLPHASPRERALLGWQFRLHVLVASSGWRTFMMLCVAGSIGMLASETSFMDQATLWRMVQANWVLTGFFFVDVALRLLSSLRPVDIFRSGPDCFQVRRGTLRGENTSAALLHSVCWHTSSRSSYLHRASPEGGKMQPQVHIYFTLSRSSCLHWASQSRSWRAWGASTPCSECSGRQPGLGTSRGARQCNECAAVGLGRV